MIYLANHKEIIRKELENYATNKLKNKELLYDFMHSEFPAKIFERVANDIEGIFARYILEFVFDYGDEYNLTFSDLQNILNKKG